MAEVRVPDKVAITSRHQKSLSIPPAYHLKVGVNGIALALALALDRTMGIDGLAISLPPNALYRKTGVKRVALNFALPLDREIGVDGIVLAIAFLAPWLAARVYR